MKRFMGFLLAFALVAASFSALEGNVKASADDTITITIGDVTISGTMGTQLTPTDIELSVSGAKFDTTQFYAGRDISDYFIDAVDVGNNSAAYSLTKKTFFDPYYISFNYGIYGNAYYKPLGLTVTITEATESKVTCRVTGTPLTLSISKIKVFFKPSMFKDGPDGASISVVNTNAKWSVYDTNGKYLTSNADATITGYTNPISGTAGTALDSTIKLELKYAVFAFDIDKDTDLSDWFSGIQYEGGTHLSSQLPVGVSAVAAEKIKAGDSSCTIRFTGTPLYKCSNNIKAKIPAKYVIGRTGGTTGDQKNCWRNTPVVNSIPSTLKFSVTSSVNEPVYTVFNSTDTIIYAGYTYESNDDDAYNNPAMPRVYMITYNDNFRSNPYNSGEWRNGDTGYKYSNQNGELNTNAEGFLYSPGGDGSANGHLYVSNIRVNVNQGWETSSGNNNTLYMSIYGTPYKVGEYRLSYFFEGNRFNRQDYTTPIVGRGKLVVWSPFQLKVENADIVLKAGEEADAFFTVKPSINTLNGLKEELSAANLKYTVSDTFKNTGLQLSPVSVTNDSVVFHITGVPTKELDKTISDIITFDYSDFDTTDITVNESIQVVKLDKNPDATIYVDMEGYVPTSQDDDPATPTSGQIDYTARDDVKIYATKGGEVVSTAAINMTQEKLELSGVTYDCYSIDGGTKWKQGTLDETKFAKQLIKGVKLSIADGYDSKEKKPGANANIYTFGEVKKQPAKAKFKAEYKTYEDTTGATPGQFALAENGTTVLTPAQLRAKYEIGVVDTSTKKVNASGYGLWPEEGGVLIAAIGADGKAVKTIYYVRTFATTSEPAGKIAKVSVAGQQKSPKVKIDYKNEVIKAKENMYAAVVVQSNDNVIASALTKENAKKGIAIGNYLQEGARTRFKIWQGASAKKPASAIQTIDAEARAAVVTTGTALTVTNGKFKLDKKYEVYNETNQKWGSLPKVTGDTTLKVRVKADAKGGKEDGSHYAASENMNLVITWGVIDAEKNKSGILTATIEPIQSEADAGTGDTQDTSGGSEEASGGT